MREGCPAGDRKHGQPHEEEDLAFARVVREPAIPAMAIVAPRPGIAPAASGGRA